MGAMKFVFVALIINSICGGDYANAEPMCPELPNFENGKTEYTYNIGPLMLMFECHEGYTLTGSQYLTCLPSGEWSDPMPTCVKECPSINGIENGVMDSIYDDATGTTDLSFTCNEGFTLFGSHQLTCLPNGEWSDSKPVCIQESSTNCEDKQWMCGTVFQFFYKEFGASKLQACESKFVNYVCCATCKGLTTDSQST